MSLHPSGDYRDAWTTGFMAAEGMQQEERVRLSWPRQEPENGWVYAYRIKIPESQLAPMQRGPPASVPAVDYWHPIPEPGRTTEFTVMIGPTDEEQGPLPGGNVGARLVAGLTARNGDAVALMVHDSRATPESDAAIEAWRSDTVAWLRAQGRTGWHHQRQIVAQPDRHGVGTAVELAIPDDDRA